MFQLMGDGGVKGDDATWREEVADFAPPVRVEPSPRWVRVVLAGRTVANSKQPMLHVSYGRPIRPGSRKPELPTYFFKEDEVDRSILQPAEKVDGRQWWHANLDGQTVEYAAWSYAETAGPVERLAGYLTFDWDQMDAWYEEDEEVYEHARDPQHRVDVIASTRQVRVMFNGQQLASSEQPRLLFETTLPTRYYLPPEDVDFDYLESSDLVTRCPYKGIARFWSVRGAGREGRNVAWSYRHPIAENPKIKDLVAFYNERVDIILDGELLQRPLTPWS